MTTLMKPGVEAAVKAILSPAESVEKRADEETWAGIVFGVRETTRCACCSLWGPHHAVKCHFYLYTRNPENGKADCEQWFFNSDHRLAHSGPNQLVNYPADPDLFYTLCILPFKERDAHLLREILKAHDMCQEYVLPLWEPLYNNRLCRIDRNDKEQDLKTWTAMHQQPKHTIGDADDDEPEEKPTERTSLIGHGSWTSAELVATVLFAFGVLDKNTTTLDPVTTRPDQLVDALVHKFEQGGPPSVTGGKFERAEGLLNLSKQH